jgi:hypothetical protein
MEGTSSVRMRTCYAHDCFPCHCWMEDGRFFGVQRAIEGVCWGKGSAIGFIQTTTSTRFERTDGASRAY